MVTLRRVDITDPLVRAALASLIADTFEAGSFAGGVYKVEPTGVWWIGFDGKQAVAFAGMRPSVRWEKVGYLCLAGVLPSHRGQGLQKRMIKARVAHARALKWQAVLTETIFDNPHSMTNLIDCGFRPYAPAIPWGDKSAVYWRRFL